MSRLRHAELKPYHLTKNRVIYSIDQFFDEGSAFSLTFLIFRAVLQVIAHSLFRWFFERLRLACCNLA